MDAFWDYHSEISMKANKVRTNDSIIESMNSTVQLPNFYIVGAPKCGTTALYAYLKEHPQIFMPDKKEPKYFATDYHSLRDVQSLQVYLSLFQSVTHEHLAIGEASVVYLRSQDAIRNIKDFNPDAKIIVMLRNPVDMLYSQHSQLLYTLDEDEPNFKVAWELQDTRRRGEHIPARCRDPRLIQYREMGLLGNQVERLLEHFDAKQVLFILFDDFKHNTERAYIDVLGFLGVSKEYIPEFKRINTNKKHRFARLAVITQRGPSRSLIVIYKAITKMLGISRLRILDRIRELNKVSEVRPPIDENLKAILQSEFAQDMRKLERLIARDLSAWYS